jgi:hypothetical protein
MFDSVSEVRRQNKIIISLGFNNNTEVLRAYWRRLEKSVKDPAGWIGGRADNFQRINKRSLNPSNRVCQLWMKGTHMIQSLIGQPYVPSKPVLQDSHS